ncbi:MAG TPA: anti-sigma factor [Usitatibacter sp.]|nr:anti-sigma factor [Usitatibacter sp.]
MTEEEDRVEYADQNNLLRRQFDAVMTEPIPARMYMKRPAWLDYARAAVFVAAGIAIGLAIPLLRPAPASPSAMITPLPIRAARAHLVYSPEVRHPVEVEAKEQDHLVKWLSKRLEFPLKVPVLSTEGFELLGGRLLPGTDGPVAQFMYQDSTGKRLTLYVTRPHKGDEVTAFRFAQEGRVSVFYWIDRECGYALSGELDRPQLARVASSVYRQLEP